MAELTHACPDCGSIDVEVSSIVKMAKCPNCDWEGLAARTLGVASTEDFWDIERVTEVLVRVISKHGAGPMCQVFEFIGILEKDDQETRDAIMQIASAACIQAAFGAAHAIHIKKIMSKDEADMTDEEKKLVSAAKEREAKKQSELH